MINAKKQYISLDLFKFIFAIVVVSIHTTPLADLGVGAVNWFYLNTFCNIAVPFFFVTSGFLFFDKISSFDTIEENREYAKKYLMHIAKMYIVWCIIWLPFKILNAYTSNQNNIEYYLTHIKDIILVSGGDALWYLLALFVSIIIVYLLKRKLSTKVILIISFVFYVLGVLISSFYHLFEQIYVVELYYSIFKNTYNGLLYGFVYISIGMYMAQKKQNNVKIHKYLIGSIISFILVIIEAFIIYNAKYNYNGVCVLLTMPITIYMLFNIILKINFPTCINVNLIKLRDYSTLIYLSHCVIIRLLLIICGVLSIQLYYVVKFVITLTVSLLFAMIVRYLDRERNIKFFKLLY